MSENRNQSLTRLWRRRSSRLTLAAVLVGAAVVLLGALVIHTVDRSQAASAAPASSSAVRREVSRASTKAHGRPKTKNSIKVRVRVGQKVSMTRLQPVESRHGATAKIRSRATAKAPSRTATKAQPRLRPARSWSLVASPANTKVTHVPGTATFAPDVHGTYVFKRKSGSAKGNEASPRRLILEVEPAEQMVCVNTRVWPTGSKLAVPPLVTQPEMKVGDQEFTQPPVRLGEPTAIQVVVLDRATGGYPNDGTRVNSAFSDTDAGVADYNKFLSDLGRSHLVLVSGFVAQEAKEAVWGPLERLGAADIDIPSGGSLAFSVIGIPGSSKGSAWQTAAPSGAAPDPDSLTPSSCDADVAGQSGSNVSGWLTRDTTGMSYSYVSPDFVDFDTDASAPAGMHAIEVGSQTYTVPTGQWNGFHAVVVDRRALCPEARKLTECKPLPVLLNQGYGPENGGLDAMNAALAKWSANPDALLFLAPFTGTSGAMTGVVPSIDLITTLRGFGASPLAPGRSLGIGVKYALVGGGLNNGLPDGTAKPIVAESFTGFGHGKGQIAGTMVRDRQNRFGPREASLSGTQLATLGEIVYAPSSPWPEENKPALEAAFEYLTEQVGYPVSDQRPHGVRDQYLAWTSASSVPDPATELDPQGTWCTASPAANVDATACATVLHELRNEFLEVKFVDNFLDRLQKAYIETEAGHANEDVINKVEGDIRTTLTPPPAKTSLALTIVHFVLSVASAIPEVGEVFEVAGAELDLAESLSADGNGSTADPMQAVYDTGDDLLNASDRAFDNAVKQIDAYQPLIVSDHAKLTLVGHRAATGRFKDGTDLDNPPWVVTDIDLEQARTGLETALKQWLYPPLVDAGFPVWRFTIPSDDNWNPAGARGRTPQTYRCTDGWGHDTHPFGDLPADPGRAWVKLSNGHDGTAANPTFWYLALGSTKYTPHELMDGGHHAPLPEAALLTEMFDDVGLDPTWYFEHMLKRQVDTGGQLVLNCLDPS